MPPKTLASPRPAMAILSRLKSRRGKLGLDLARELELRRLDGEFRDVDVAQGERADPGEGAGGGIEAEDRPAELDPAAEKLQADGLEAQGVDPGAQRDVHRLHGQEGVLELADDGGAPPR